MSVTRPTQHVPTHNCWSPAKAKAKARPVIINLFIMKDLDLRSASWPIITNNRLRVRVGICKTVLSILSILTVTDSTEKFLLKDEGRTSLYHSLSCHLGGEKFMILTKCR